MASGNPRQLLHTANPCIELRKLFDPLYYRKYENIIQNKLFIGFVTGDKVIKGQWLSQLNPLGFLQIQMICGYSQ